MKKLYIAIAIISIFGSGFVVGSLYYNREVPSPKLTIDRAYGHNPYPLINPLFDVEYSTQTTEGDLLRLKTTLKNYVESNSTEIIHLSVYFRDLNNGPWFGLNDDEEFSPASLLKVPILIAFLKTAEKNHDFLKRKYTYQDVPTGVTQDILPTGTDVMVIGNEYSISELLEAMIIRSDNRAKNTLLVNAKEVDFDAIYNDLGIEVPGVSSREDFMSVRRYATFFRILYNASYLTKEDSQKALALLSRVEYRKGLVAGVPSSIQVAHKFGERIYDGKTKQLHDCGIIYYPKKPYVLCVMTKGYDWDKLASAISYVSAQTFETIQAQEQ